MEAIGEWNANLQFAEKILANQEKGGEKKKKEK